MYKPYLRGVFVKTYIEERVVSVARYIIEKRATVRRAAKKFSVSKSTVHKDVAERLEYLNKSMFDEVREVLEENKAERHLRGGKATKERFSRIK